MYSSLLLPIRQISRQAARIAALAALAVGFVVPAYAQADGSVSAVVAPAPVPMVATGVASARIAALDAPGGALMNNLHDRMRLIQATQDPALRQRRMDEFLKALQSGMVKIGSPTAIAGR